MRSLVLVLFLVNLIGFLIADGVWEYLGASPSVSTSAAIGRYGLNVLVYGGDSSTGEPMDTFSLFDTTVGRWSTYTVGNASMPGPRTGACGLTYGNMFIVWGGSSYDNGVYAYSYTGTYHWVNLTSSITGPLPPGRSAATCTLYDDKMWVFGGSPGNGMVIYLDLLTYVWVTPQVKGQVPGSLYGASVSVNGSTAYVVQGNINLAYTFNFATLTFKQIDPADGCDALLYGSGAVRFADRLLMFGGAGDRHNYNVSSFIFESGGCEPFNTTGIAPVGSSQSVIVLIGNIIYVLGGVDAHFEPVSQSYAFIIDADCDMWKHYTYCLPCGPGLSSMRDGNTTTCGYCTAGFSTDVDSFNSGCSNCIRGYSPTVASTCTPCPRGYSDAHTAIPEFCIPCDAGFYSLANSVSCSPCPAGWMSSEPLSYQCSPCEQGSYASDLASTQCYACPNNTLCSIATGHPTPLGNLTSDLQIAQPQYSGTESIVWEWQRTAILTGSAVVVLFMFILLLLFRCCSKPIAQATSTRLARVDFMPSKHEYLIPGPLMTKKTALGGFLTVLYAFVSVIVVAVLVVQFVLARTEQSTLLPGFAPMKINESFLKVNLTLYDLQGPCNTSTYNVTGLSHPGVFVVLADNPDQGQCSLQWSCQNCVINKPFVSLLFTFGVGMTCEAYTWGAESQSYQKDSPSAMVRSETASNGTRFAGAATIQLASFQAIQTIDDNDPTGGYLVQYIDVINPTEVFPTSSTPHEPLEFLFSVERSSIHVNVVVSSTENVVAFLGQLLAYLSGVFGALGVGLLLLEKSYRIIARKSGTSAENIPLVSST